MRKSDKKIDKQLRVILTNICEDILKNFEGFEWLTHLVNYDDFPKSLKIICVFDTNNNLSTFMQSNHCDELALLIQKAFFEANVHIKYITQHISYDTEEKCKRENHGKWADRLK